MFYFSCVSDVFPKWLRCHLGIKLSLCFLVVFTRCLPSRHLWALGRRRRAEDMTHISSLSASFTFPTWWYINTVSPPRVVEKSSEMQISHRKVLDLNREVVKNQAKTGPLLIVFNEHWDRDGSLCSVGVLQGPCRCLDWPHHVSEWESRVNYYLISNTFKIALLVRADRAVDTLWLVHT